jgi:RNA polymerase sigma factor (sigma-70 family)
MATETEGRLRQALASLPAAYREVVERYELGGESAREVARGLGRSVGAVFMIRARAIKRLLELLGSVSRAA